MMEQPDLFQSEAADYDAWGRRVTCEVCGERLRKLLGAGRPPKFCRRRKCLAEAKNRTARERWARRKESRCSGCGGCIDVPCPRNCPTRGVPQ